MQTFPQDFKWGAATAAYQIEGGAADDGRGPSVWDIFSHIPGKTLNGDTGDVACDHYHRWQEDIQLMQQLGIKHYRLSISWSRVIPNGVGAVNEAGLAFYDRLVDGLLAAGITPAITLYHWDLPQGLETNGGWSNRSVIEAFGDYTALVTKKLGDRVKMWITLNEPQVYTISGYGTGRHAPGRTDMRLALQAVHNTLLSHGLAMRVIREQVQNAEAGITLNLYPFYPASDTPADRLAARFQDAIVNRMFLDPVFGHGYPQELAMYYGDLFAEVLPGDMEQIAAPLDFLGINYYFPQHSKVVSVSENPDGFRRLMNEELTERGYDLTQMGWPVDADAMVDLFKQVQKTYQPKAIYITENGASYPDEMQGNTVNDEARTRYLQLHLAACLKAIEEGIPLKGYFVWSLMDNFEWALGYARRFGITYVDYQTLKRIPKRSFNYYQQVIKANAPIEF